MEAFPLLPIKFLRVLSPCKSSLFPFIKKTLLFVSKWLKYSHPSTSLQISSKPKPVGAVFAPVPWWSLPSLTLSLLCIYSPKYVTWGSYEILPQLEQRSSLPRSRCRSVAFALHQKWRGEVEGRQLKVLSRSQENRHTVLKCRNILLSNKKIFFFWQVQTVLALKTSPCLTSISRTDCPLGKRIENNREYLHLGQAFLLSSTH